MASTAYKLFEHVAGQLGSGHLFVEIGSARDGKSTNYLNALARSSGNNFITIDVDPILLGKNVQSARMSGEEFVKIQLPLMNKNVNLVYLDNMDWIKQPILLRRGGGLADDYNLISEYDRLHNVQLNNVNSSLVHLKQIKGLLPFMSEACAVLLEGTWFNHSTDTFSGKGGPAAYLLMSEGFTVISASWRENYVMMGKNVIAPGLPNLVLDRLNKKQTDLNVRGDAVLYENVV